MVEVSRIGLTLLTPNEVASEGLPKVNIIFVHGLRGHPRRTWVAASPSPEASLEETPKSKSHGKLASLIRHERASGASKATNNNPVKGVFWPEELLAHDLPQARVWSYGYNADLINGMFGANNKNKVTQHSRDFAVRLERELDNQDPIIFVAHSLGGVVVKDALAKSEKACARTRAAIFLGTPHRGSRSAGWGGIVANLSKLVLQDVNDKLLQNLEVHGEMLERIDDEFKLLVQKYQIRIHSFQEGRGISGVRGFHGKIVEDFSSKLGLPRSMETVETMDADHREMARCRDRSDPKYKAIHGVIRQIIVDFPGPSRRKGIVAANNPLVDNEISLGQSRVGSFSVPYLRNGRFVGRQSIVRGLLEQTMGGKPQYKTALFGLGGVGKTQIAIEYAYAILEAQPDASVFWVFAANEERFKEGYASIAQHCKIPGHDDPKVDLLALVRKWLLDKSHGKWIMVVDNADDMDVMCNQPLNLGQYLPECSHGSILITTRNKQVGLKLTRGEGLVEVPTMGVKDSIELLRGKLDSIQLEDTEGIRQLCLQLEHLPLALVQAAAFIQENTISVRQYLELIDASDKTFTTLLSHDFETVGRDAHTPRAVAETWVLSFERIQQQNPLASDLLCLMTFYDRQAIPKRLLSIYHQYVNYQGRHRQHQDAEITKYQSFSDEYDRGNLKPELDSESRRHEIDRALGLLKAFSFITEGSSGTLSMHRLVQLVTQKWLKSDDNTRRKHFASLAIVVVSIGVPHINLVMQNMALCSEFLPHAISALNLNQDDTVRSNAMPKARLFQALSEFHRWGGRLSEAETFSLQACEIYQDILGKEDFTTLECLGGLVRVWVERRKLKEANDLALENLNQWRTRFGENHLSTIKATLDLAYCYKNQGRTREEIKLRENLQQSLKDQNLQRSREAILNTVELGTTYRNLAQHRNAEVILLEALETSKSSLGLEDVQTTTIMLDLGTLYRLMRDWEKSKDLIEGALEGFQRRLGPKHNNTLTAMWDLAALHSEHNLRIDEAERMATAVLETRRLLHGERHVFTLNCMRLVGEIWCRQGRFADAVELLEQCYRLAKEEFGERDQRNAWILRTLCEGLEGAGKSTQAISAAEDSYHSSRELDGEDHRNTIHSADTLRRLLYKQGAYDRAEALSLLILEGRKKQLGEENNETLDAMHSLAYVWKHQDRMEEAIGLLKNCYDISRRSLGENHYDTGERADVLRAWCSEVKRYDETERLERRIYDTRKAQLGEDHGSTLTIMGDLAVTLKIQGRLDEAISLMEDCADRRERTLGPDHEVTVVCRKYLKKWRFMKKREKLIAFFGAGPGTGKPV